MEYSLFLVEISGERLDVFVSRVMEISRSQAVQLIENDFVQVNGAKKSKNHKVSQGESIFVTLPEPVALETVAQDIPLDIVYEDAHLLVVNKSRGMVVHPAVGNMDGTLVNALLAHCKDSLSGINGVLRPGIVHRIDKDTSGLLIVAKNDIAHNGLAEQIKAHSFLREYEAIACGRFRDEKGTIDAPIGRNPEKRKEMAIMRGGRPAVTHYEVLCDYGGFTHIKCRLETGRTHQIRVHLKHISHPIAGDILYGGKNADKTLGGQILHAKKIGFIHPVTKEYLEFDSDLPEYFERFLTKLGKECILE